MPSQQDIREALWSVYYHSFFRPSLTVPPERPVAVPLTGALDVLLQDYDHHDWSRRARALRKLTAAGYVNRERLLRRAGPELAGELRGRFAQLGTLLGVQLSPLETREPAEALRILEDQLQTQAMMATGCALTEITCVACLDGVTLNTTVTATALVNRPLAQLAAAIDPNEWDTCSIVFDDTHKVLLGNRPGTYTPDPTVIPKGTPWPKGPPNNFLYERVNTGLASFVNVLTINFQVSPLLIRVDYDLHDSLETKYGPLLPFPPPISGGLEEDYGFVQARPALNPALTEFTVEKTVRFDDLMLNYLAPAALCLWLEDQSHTVPCC